MGSLGAGKRIFLFTFVSPELITVGHGRYLFHEFEIHCFGPEICFMKYVVNVD